MAISPRDVTVPGAQQYPVCRVLDGLYVVGLSTAIPTPVFMATGRVGEAQLDRIGKKKWTKRVMRMLAQLEPIFNYDRLHLGGGNVKKLTEKLPDNVIRFDNVKGMMGGIRLWEAGG